jgi:DNA-binding MarR family transcriptional regulator
MAMDPVEVSRTFGIVGRRFESYLNAALNGSGVTFSESIFLVNILAREGMNQEYLSSMLLINKAATSRALRSLEEKAMVLRQPSEKDRRVKGLYLTDRGREVGAQILRSLERWYGWITDGVEAAVLDQVVAGLRIIGEQVRRMDPTETLEK